MSNLYTCLTICILVSMIVGCENYDKTIQGIEKAKDFVDTTTKKVTETREGPEKSIGKLFGKDTEQSDEKKSESSGNSESGNKEKD